VTGTRAVAGIAALLVAAEDLASPERGAAVDLRAISATNR
jgi:hypothetical protein